MQAVEERDGLVARLRGELQQSALSKEALQSEYSAQAEQLASQVHLLQQQLKQVGRSLFLKG